MIELRLTEEQANIVSSACEFYARIQMGQFQEIGYTCPKMPGALGYDEVTAAWLALRKCIYPELKGPGHSYGIGKFDTADKAYDVHQVIRYVMGDKREPFSYCQLPVCRRIPDTDKEDLG